MLPGETGAGHLAVGTSAGSTELWDVAASRALRRMDGHAARVSCLAWNGHCLSSAGRDATIVHHDVRIRDHATGSCVGHQQEICGLSWSPDGTTLRFRRERQLRHALERSADRCTFQAPAHSLTDHTAAVKALAWSPIDRHVLASGGGTADRCIKLWNASSGVNLNSVDTGSQILCAGLEPAREGAVEWPRLRGEPAVALEVPGDGAREGSQRSYWKGLSSLHVAGRVYCVESAGADETLRFWDCFGTAPAKKGKSRAALCPRASCASGEVLAVVCPLFFPTQATRRFSFVRESRGWLWGYRIAGTSVGPTRLEPLLGALSPVIFGHPTGVCDAPTASMGGASSTWTRPGAAARPPAATDDPSLPPRRQTPRARHSDVASITPATRRRVPTAGPSTPGEWP